MAYRLLEQSGPHLVIGCAINPSSITLNNEEKEGSESEDDEYDEYEYDPEGFVEKLNEKLTGNKFEIITIGGSDYQEKEYYLTATSGVYEMSLGDLRDNLDLFESEFTKASKILGLTTITLQVMTVMEWGNDYD